ncbi:MAG: methyltransferase domain-containing protein [Pseudomonadota bacterium]
MANAVDTIRPVQPGSNYGPDQCPACGAGPLEVFYEVDNVPTNSCILLSSEEEARAYPTGDIRLAFCPSCGFVHNAAFDLAKTEYSGRYEETQGYSGTFNTFHKGLAERLIKKHELRGKDVLEIGCGKGEFLLLLSQLGDNRGVGIDPGVDPDRLTGEAAERLTFIKDFYSKKYDDRPFDFVACKMTLEHIPAAERFMRDVREGIGANTDTVVFFQIPEALRILKFCAFEDIYYEHCSYFSPGSLARLFRRAGFEVLNIEIEYGEQYLTIEAKPARAPAPALPPLPIEDDLDVLRDLVRTFPARNAEVLGKWRKSIADLNAQGRTAVVWGSGSKAVSFITALGDPKAIRYVIDINPHRHGHYMPHSAQRIVAPAELKEIKPDDVIVMNRIYLDEIRNDLSDMGLSPNIMAL